ncbi:hypothetical protein HK405_003575, partial [Cladochytrium tenue]
AIPADRLFNDTARQSVATTKALGHQAPPAGTAPAAAPSASRPAFHPLLPETPAGRRVRRPRANESLMSVNGSPIAFADWPDAGDDDSGVDPDASMYGHFGGAGDRSRLASLAPRRITIRDACGGGGGVNGDSGAAAAGPAAAGSISIPVDNGDVVIELDPTVSPTRMKALGAARRKQVADQIRAMQENLARLLENMDD